MAWVNTKYECSECGALYDEWDDAKECCDYCNEVWH